MIVNVSIEKVEMSISTVLRTTKEGDSRRMQAMSSVANDKMK